MFNLYERCRYLDEDVMVIKRFKGMNVVKVVFLRTGDEYMVMETDLMKNEAVDCQEKICMS